MGVANSLPPRGTRIPVDEGTNAVTLDVGPLAPWRRVNSGTVTGVVWLAVTAFVFAGMTWEMLALRPAYKLVLAALFLLCAGSISILIGLVGLLAGLSTPLRRARFVVRDDTLTIYVKRPDEDVSVVLADVRDVHIVRELARFPSGKSETRLRVDVVGRDPIDLLQGRSDSELRWVVDRLRPLVGLRAASSHEPAIVAPPVRQPAGDTVPALADRHSGVDRLWIIAPPLGIRRGTGGRWVVTLFFLAPIFLGMAAVMARVSVRFLHDPSPAQRLLAILTIGMGGTMLWCLWACVRENVRSGRSSATFHLGRGRLAVVAEGGASRVRFDHPVDEVFDVRATGTVALAEPSVHIITGDGRRITVLAGRPRSDARRIAAQLSAAMGLPSRDVRFRRWLESGRVTVPSAASRWVVERRPGFLGIGIPPRSLVIRVGRVTVALTLALVTLCLLGVVAYLLPLNTSRSVNFGRAAMGFAGAAFLIGLLLQFHRQHIRIELTPGVFRVTCHNYLRRKARAWDASAVEDLVDNKEGVTLVVGGLPVSLFPSHDPAERGALLALLGPALGLFPGGTANVPSDTDITLQHS